MWTAAPGFCRGGVCGSKLRSLWCCVVNASPFVFRGLQGEQTSSKPFLIQGREGEWGGPPCLLTPLSIFNECIVYKLPPSSASCSGSASPSAQPEALLRFIRPCLVCWLFPCPFLPCESVLWFSKAAGWFSSAQTSLKCFSTQLPRG